MSFVEPKFVSSDEKGRETFLSQTGNFTPVERSLFHKLCEIWEPIISLKRFFKLVSKDISSADSEIKKLMIKLKSFRMGLIVTETVKNKRVPQGIILCEPDSQVFYTHVLNEEILNVSENMLLVLPTIQNLQERGVPIPKEHIEQATYQQIAELHVAKSWESSNILSIQIGSENAFVVPQKAISRVSAIQISKMQLYFRTEAFFELAASIMRKSLTELRANIALRDPIFWLNLSRIFNENRGKLDGQQKVKLPVDLFSTTYFLENFLMAQIDAVQKHRAEEQNRKADMQSIVELIRNYDGYLAPGEFLEHHIDGLKEKYADNFESFREDFDKTLLHNDEKAKLPVLLNIYGSYIHGENVKDFFLKRVERVSKDLGRYYLSLMDQYIKGSRTQRVNTFDSTESFEADIKKKVRELDNALSFLLNAPSIVAEALIQSGQKTGQVSNVDDMKALLVSFFYPNQVKYKELQIIFNLNIKELYQRAFLATGILRQLVMRITGKYESCTKKFSEQSRVIYQRMMKEAALPENYRISSRKEKQKESGEKRVLPSSNKTDTNAPRKQSPPVPRKGTSSRVSAKSKYSRREQDRAWSEFSKRLKE